MTIDAMNDDGVHLTMDGSGYGTANGRYELHLLFFEASAVGADGELIQGAQPKYVMKDTISMGGNLAGGTYNLHGTEIEVTDHTGCLLYTSLNSIRIQGLKSQAMKRA